MQIGGSNGGSGERARDDAHERLVVTWAGSRDGLWDWDLAARELRTSPRWKELLGYAASEIGSSPEEWLRRVHPGDLELLRGAIDRHVAGASDRLECEFRIRHKDGGWRWMQCHGSADAEGRLIGGSMTDVTERKESEEWLLHEFFHDRLTQLPNEALFLDRLGQALGRVRLRRQAPIAVLYLDLDRFRTVNNSLGVQAGNVLLVEAAQRLAAALGPGDTLARLGGDKFGVLIEGVDGPAAAVHVAERMEVELARPLQLEGHEIIASASIGIALSAERHEKPEDLLRDAIAAMHLAKEDGAVRHLLFDPALNERAKERLRLETDLHHALERGEFRLHYQPIIDFRTGGLHAFEALIRWQHPDRGLVPPDVFIPVAEETGLIVPLGRWILEQACQQSNRWRRELPSGRDLAVAVNISARQLDDGTLFDEIEGCLKRTGLEPAGLELEMTESDVMARTHENTRMLESLRSLGVRLLIDDFGTGYSSLASLHSFPLDTLKIDRSFVSQMEFDQERAEIVRIILTLAKKLGMSAVAEGVETADQLRMLRELECEHGQGFYFSNAIDGESASAWIERCPRW